MGDLDEHCSDVEDNVQAKKEVIWKFKLYLQVIFVFLYCAKAIQLWCHYRTYRRVNDSTC